MTKIVKANLPHTVLLQDQWEMLCDISGLHKLTDFIDIDIISKLPAIRFSAQLSVQLLFRFQAVQQFLKNSQTLLAGVGAESPEVIAEDARLRKAKHGIF